MKSAITAWMVCLVCLSCIAVPAAANGEVAVEPASITGTLAAGGTQEALITITLPESVPRGDVVFAFDTTGSMGNVLDTMKGQGIQVMLDIRESIPDSRFGAVSFMDYPTSYTDYYGYSDTYGEAEVFDYAYRLDQELTVDIIAVSAGISSIPKGSGGDWPQDYTRIIYESLFFPWRTDAKKILVLFGDAPPHAAPSGLTLMDPWAPPDQPRKLFARDDAPYGGDPGRDELAGTDDDLDYVPVIQDAAESHITIVGVYCPNGGQLDEMHRDAENNFMYMTTQTNGLFVVTDPKWDSSVITSQIVSMIGEMAKKDILELGLQVREEAYRSWITLPEPHTNVQWPSTNIFNTAITPPAGTPDGTYRFTIDVLGDGVVLGSVPVTLQVTGGKVVEPLTVALDLKPGSCPNSFNPKEKGVLPAAILGSRELKVSEIDLKSIRLARAGGTAGVKPLRSSTEDVGSPSGRTCSCGVQSGKEDRKKDLTLKFDAEEVVKTLGITKDEGCIRVTVTGVLLDGTPFTGSDYLRVLNTGPGSCDGRDGKGDKDNEGSCDQDRGD